MTVAGVFEVGALDPRTQEMEQCACCGGFFPQDEVTSQCDDRKHQVYITVCFPCKEEEYGTPRDRAKFRRVAGIKARKAHRK